MYKRQALKDGRTILEDLSFTAPYKIMMPFEKENGGIQIMPLCASAGIMAGDSQEFSYHVKEGADLEVLSQSFEKIHKMDEGSATRTIEVQVDKNATLYYYPQPVIPFAQSAFDSKMTIHLEDATSRLFLLEIISCGRNAHDERFQYRRLDVYKRQVPCTLYFLAASISRKPHPQPISRRLIPSSRCNFFRI